MNQFPVHVEFPGRLVFVGFGSIGQGVLPLILRHIGIDKQRISIVTSDARGKEEAQAHGIKFIEKPLEQRWLQKRKHQAVFPLVILPIDQMQAPEF